MFTLSAFADEISPEPNEQVAVLKECGLRHIEFRSIYKTNVLALSEGHVREFKALLDDEGFGLSAIGSPIGKVPSTSRSAAPGQVRRAIDIAKLFRTPNIRIFSYYPPDNFGGNWAPYRDEVMSRMRQKVRSPSARIQLFHENEHRIYGDSPERLADLFATVRSPKLKAAFDPRTSSSAGTTR